jgi:hypothetical protein
VLAKIDDCAIFADMTQADGSPLPSFITYDAYKKVLTVIVGASQDPVTVNVKTCAYLNDKVTLAKSECKENIIEIYAPLTFSSQYFNFKTEKPLI